MNVGARVGPLQIGGVSVPSNFVELVLNASIFTQVVLGLLIVLSVMSWTIMFVVWRQMAKASGTAAKFASEVEGTYRLDDAGAIAKRSVQNALPRLLLRALHYVSETQQVNESARDRRGLAAESTLSAAQVETLHLVLESEASAERSRLGRLIPWLAMIGSVSPLIGLLGTVLGIIQAFLGIALRGSGNLAAVAPGVGEALVATAAALAVAIPATFGYNILANRLNRFDVVMETFGTAIVARLAREGHI